MLADTRDFENRIAGQESVLQRFFDSPAPVTLTRAPGGLDVFGGIADYSGSLVAEATIGEAIRVALQPRKDSLVRVWSRDAGSPGHTAEAPLDRIFSNSETLASDPASRRAAYVLGCYSVLWKNKLLPDDIRGANIVVEGSIPASAGLSSSAALEVATLQAIAGAYGLALDAEKVAVLAQRVDHAVGGAPCGIMGPMASALGEPGQLLLILCQPHSVQGFSELPKGVRIFGVHSGVNHSDAGASSARARIAAFMGRKLINDRRKSRGEEPLTYLCQLSPTRYRRDHAPSLPGKMSGQEFLEAVGDHEDPATKIAAETLYPVRAATEHAVYEHGRVKTFLNCMDEAGQSNASRQTIALIKAGVAMYGSHWSYTRIGLGARETTILTRLAREAGPSKGVFGAKITGCGSGGVVAMLTNGDDAEESIAEIAAEYARLTGNDACIVEAGKSPGAAAFGCRTLVLA
ncbi:MAG: hypothetical protein P4L33_21085 [Capsulimonadaceae bacterium]|nr:hypothetical protein [Capsulimonadaceae bacterium]